jgi:hypothetical protein
VGLISVDSSMRLILSAPAAVDLDLEGAGALVRTALLATLRRLGQIRTRASCAFAGCTPGRAGMIEV